MAIVKPFKGLRTPNQEVPQLSEKGFPYVLRNRSVWD